MKGSRTATLERRITQAKGQPAMTGITPPALKDESEIPNLLLYKKTLKIIQDKATSKGIIKNSIIPFPLVFSTLSWYLHLAKNESFELFQEFKGAGLIEIVPYHGIRITKH